jgi:NAD(P)H-hydrate repair Nnr-like enzyme with NAD(P)H-hydrate epimerase domain
MWYTHTYRYGLIRDAALFEWLEANMGRLLARDAEAIAYAVERSCINKAEVCVCVCGGGGGEHAMCVTSLLHVGGLVEWVGG